MWNLFKRLFNIGKGQATQAVTALEGQNLEALVALEEEKVRVAESNFNMSMKKNAGIVETLRSNKNRLEKDIKETEIKLKSHIKAGNENVAKQLIIELNAKKQEFSQYSEDFTHAEKQEADLIKIRDASVKAAKENIATIKKNIQIMHQQESIAALQETATGMVTDIGGSGDTISRVASIVEERKNQAIGAARIARTSVDTSSIQINEQEKDALASNALDEYLAQSGMTLKGKESAETAPAQRQMGPAQTV